MADRVFAEFPYDRRFTKEEIAEITARAEKIADALRDGVAPNGAILYIDESLLQLWSVHAALAGVYVDDDRAYIVSVKIPDQAGQFADSVEWVMREDLPEDHSDTQADAEARQIVDALTERLSPEVQRRVAEQFSTAFSAVNDPDQED